MRILTVIILLLIPTILHAADLCDAGYYLADSGECETCPNQYYCPGDKIRYECPDAKLHKRTTFPNYYYNPVIDKTGITATPGKKTLQNCAVLSWLKSERGELYEYAGYNTDTGEYDMSGTYNWAAVNPGYYLTTPTGCTGWTYYHDILECPNGSYCPGKNRVYCDAANEATVHTQTFGLETCPDNTYSDAGAATCTPCPKGTGNHGDNISAHAGVSSCLPLCATGYTKLHAGNYVFNLWSENKCTSPSLRIHIENNTCCINLEPNRAQGINVQIGNDIYHVTN
ncbi:MAG: hypothetical protein K2M34_00705 [Alphaproteobacteria bacterium]|nr:hypothetical protein [Alphaproteobacteria bacterium]